MKLFVFFLLVLFLFYVKVYEYFFVFVEVNYNVIEKVFEVILEVFVYDVEDVLKENCIDIGELEDYYCDFVMFWKLEEFICLGFSINIFCSLLLYLMGYEVEKNGFVYFYLKLEFDKDFWKVMFWFDWLMDILLE